MPKDRLKSHAECCARLCFICLNKAAKDNMRTLTEQHHKLIKEFIMDGYDPSDERLPTSICSTCRLTLLDYAAGKTEKRIEIYNHKRIGSQPRITRSAIAAFEDRPCDCIVCTIARSNINCIAGLPKKARGRPPATCSDTSTPSRLLLCSHCLGAIARGKSHDCSFTKRLANISDLITQGPATSSDYVAHSIVKRKVATDSSEISLAAPGGRHPFKLTPSPSPSQPLFNHSSILSMQQDLNLSTRETLRLGQSIRSTTGIKSVESNLRDHLYQTDHKLDELFKVDFIDFVKKEKNKIIEKTSRWTVLCTDVNGLIDRISTEREYEENDELLVKIGIDGGGDFLKVCLSLIRLNAEQQSSATKSKYQDGGVKRLFIIAIGSKIQENYENVLKVWVSLELHKLRQRFTIACDLKMSNILLGIMAHGSLHPCSWCNASKGKLHLEGENRTTGNLRENYWNWHEDGQKVGRSKVFDNVIHPAIVKSTDPTTSVLELIPPPELHLLLGPTNAIYKGMTDIWEGSGEWLKFCNVEREALHGGSFTGNSCKLLLSNLDTLQSICPLECLPFLECFRYFSKVVSACYGHDLDPNFEQHITNFRQSYMSLDISVTPKVHAVFHHVGQFCQQKRRGLGSWSEQASEAVHHDFSLIWDNFKVRSLDHPQFKTKLLRAVCVYNGRHM